MGLGTDFDVLPKHSTCETKTLQVQIDINNDFTMNRELNLLAMYLSAGGRLYSQELANDVKLQK